MRKYVKRNKTRMKLPPDLRQKEEKRNMEEEEEMKIIHRVKFGAFSSVTLF